MSEDQWKGGSGGSGDPHQQQHHHHEHKQPAPQYGTFLDTSSQPPAIGFPQPVPPPGRGYPPPHGSEYPTHPGPNYYSHGYQAVPAYAVVEGRPLREPRLPCCGIGLGWFLFIVGFFLAAIPWYVAAFILLCATRVDHREKPGYVACTIAAVIGTIAIVFGATKGADVW